VSVLLLNKDWMAVFENRAVGRLTGEDKQLIWLQAWTAVHTGTACWMQRWHAVTWGAGPEGTDERFKDGRMQPHMIGRRGNSGGGGEAKASSQVDEP
jgi:hypothetical protein